eukprot:103858-Rhodomonas_salina.1
MFLQRSAQHAGRSSSRNKMQQLTLYQYELSARSYPVSVPRIAHQTTPRHSKYPQRHRGGRTSASSHTFRISPATTTPSVSTRPVDP